MTARPVISNAGPLMALAKLNQLHLLADLYTEVAVPDVVYAEVVARAEASRLGLAVKGTLGILAEAYRSQKLQRGQLELLFEEIAARADIWISAALCRQVLAKLLAE